MVSGDRIEPILTPTTTPLVTRDVKKKKNPNLFPLVTRDVIFSILIRYFRAPGEFYRGLIKISYLLPARLVSGDRIEPILTPTTTPLVTRDVKKKNPNLFPLVTRDVIFSILIRYFRAPGEFYRGLIKISYLLPARLVSGDRIEPILVPTTTPLVTRDVKKKKKKKNPNIFSSFHLSTSYLLFQRKTRTGFVCFLFTNLRNTF